ncbi:MAG: hypothetical protein A2756_03385 [Candidatus Ryanbacteria bacterium RIFCSPHIGHO2_01_FULL_48_27]|uniref:SGNH hydrolase-type esterase domain-containing protein n=1 Tax=Candidatus Ryanbacteria bacterium RIFCSPHIGHO2_01_FULL_48_27 TaxID=1802115 RepID=A0A1G2G4H6_9BACT|nr:MAG: hypothetical protein A2756_03385 [Candidatus Ryanbacteria bacterium RIFCSPHIGHO2_01_FULL_48_27]
MQKKVSGTLLAIAIPFFVVIIIPLFIVTLFEVALRIHPQLIDQEYVNYVFGKQTRRDSGIFEYDPDLKIYFMKKNFYTTMYANGYVWDHQTDARGFRNPTAKETSDIVLLGDSFVYGHGVNQDQTLAYFLETKGYSAYNLAQQGDNAYSEMYMLSQYGLFLKPKYVFYFYFTNDIKDLFMRGLDKEQMREFIKQPMESISFKESTNKINFPNTLSDKFYIGKYLKFRKLVLDKKKKSQSVDTDLGWKFTKKAIEYMAYISKQNGVEFVMVPIVKDTFEDYQILKDFSSEHNIAFVETLDMNNENYYLQNDGHFNEEGHRKMAELIETYLQTH